MVAKSTGFESGIFDVAFLYPRTRKRGVPADVAIPGAVLRGGAALGAGGVGGLIGQALVPIPGLGYLAGAGGGVLASYLADRYLPTREQFGRGLHKVNKAYGEQPYFGML